MNACNLSIIGGFLYSCVLRMRLSNHFAVLVFYDYMCSFQDEVEVFWRRSFRPATAVFMANRYLCICYVIPLILERVVLPTPLVCLNLYDNSDVQRADGVSTEVCAYRQTATTA